MFSEIIGRDEGISDRQLAETVARLAPYDRLDLIAGVGALHLLPENADRLLRLEAAAALIALSSGSASGDRPRMGTKRWKDLLNKAPIGTSVLSRDEDPLDTLFVDQITFVGGSHLVLPGLVQDAVFISRQLIRCVLLSPSPFPDREFVDFVRRMVGLVLGISDAVVRRAGLKRGTQPIHPGHRQVVVPNHSLFDGLKRAVTFSAADVHSILRSTGSSLVDLDVLTMPPGAGPLSTVVSSRSPILRAPLVRVGDSLVVAAPAVLLSVLRHIIVTEAGKRGLTDELATRYRMAVADSVGEALGHLRCEQIGLKPPSVDAMPLRAGWFSLDRDKLLHAVVVTDPIVGYDADDPFGTWHAGDLAAQLRAYLATSASQALALEPAPSEVLFVIVMQGIGRHFSMTSPDEIVPTGSSLLVLRAAELETIAHLERGHALALRQFAEAGHRFHSRTRVLAFDQLDEFAFYRGRGYSYYASDEALPTEALFSTGLAESLHLEVFQRYDPHGVRWIDGRSIVEVVLAHDDASIPIYLRQDTRNIAAMLIEGLPVNIWIVSPSPLPDTRLFGQYLEMTELLAYWLWQISPSLEELLALVGRDITMLRVKVLCRDHERWLEIASGVASERRETEDLQIKGSISGNDEILFEFEADLFVRMEQPDNSAERDVVRGLLRALGDWLIQHQVTLPEGLESWIETIITKHAPLGLKKKIVALGGDQAQRVSTAGLPPRRTVQAAEEERILDEVGDFLASGLELPVGKIADADRVRILNSVVSHLFQRLDEELAKLDPNGVLDWLVAFNERLLVNYRLAQINLPTREACFGASHDIVAQLRKDIPESSKASVASRFLIEYVASRPPNGTLSMSLATYDRLIALASQISNFGWSSELIHFGLADIKLAHLASGRLGQSRGQFDRGREAFLDTFTLGTLGRSRRDFGRHWKMVDGESEMPPLVAEIDVASTKDIGFSVTELLEVMIEGINAGGLRSGPAKIASRDDLVTELVTALGWEATRVDNALSFLSLAPRPSFLQPPAPYRPADVYPWRFNRALSYLRRPFLQRESEGTTQIVWGVKNVFEAFDYLQNLVLSGRLKTPGTAVRKVVGRVRAAEAEEFNDQVADACGALPGVTVGRQVQRFGRLRIARQNGQPLGDIDVLVIDPLRRLIWSIETKDLAPARTPAELANELQETFGSGGSRPSHAEKHSERSEWLRQHVPEILAHFGLSATSANSWKVQALIVVSHELMGPYITATPIQVVPYRDLNQVLAMGRATTRRP